MEKMTSNNTMMSMYGSDNFSVLDDDQLMMIMSSTQHHLFDPMLCPKAEDQTAKVKSQRKRRKPKNLGGENGAVHGKRKLTEYQAAQLELFFEIEPKLETERKEKIAAELGLEPRQVAVWFQNRRARWKCKKLEDEFENLRASHHSILAQKIQLEAQVSELSGRLVEARSEIHRLSGTLSNGNTSTPSSSSLSMDNHAHTSAELQPEAGFAMDNAQLLENDHVRVMDYYWMNNMYDMM